MHKSGNLKLFIIFGLLFLETISVFLTFKSFSNRNIDEIKETFHVDKNVFAMYVENDSNEYVEYTDSNCWPSGYKLNSTKTSCVDNKGNSVEINNLVYKKNQMTVLSNKTIFCYLYFDKDNSIYAQVSRDYVNNVGAKVLSDTESDDYPIYYYYGAVTNNNILYGNFCWKMVRTTETGGVKLIYNGVPDEAEDGTLTCDNTGTESQIGTSAFNSSYNSLAYVGYMYNEVYPSISKGSINTTLITYTNKPAEYYYADTATWNPETNKYELSNSDGTTVSTYVWSESYDKLGGYFTCRSLTETKCTSVYYITSTSSTHMYHYILSEGKSKDDYVLKFATSITDNGNGTFTLNEPIEVLKKNWYTDYADYKDYYYCEDVVSETCDVIYYAGSTSNRILYGYNVENIYKYGNSVIYEDGVYKLVNTIEFWNWPQNYNTLNNNHYTCFDYTDECESVNYIYFTNSSTAYYITLSGGEFVEDAINKMLYPDDVNKTDSTMKNTLDTWYENNIVDELDSNSVLYSSYLENTIWCNNREISTLNGWNPNGGDTTKYLYFNYTASECSNKLDQFTLKVEAGGTEGYGNNELDYPIGLLTRSEASVAAPVNGYLETGNNYWLLSPYRFSSNYANGFCVYSGGSLYGHIVYNTYGVRPAVSLSSSVDIIDGDGTVENPYKIEKIE